VFFVQIDPKPQYSLTPLGETLVKPLKNLCDWASEHMHEVETARAKATDEKLKLDEVVI
jgi:DNA-binding HxlR family transcriptional regulator